MVNSALALSSGAMEQWQIMTQQAEMLVKSGFMPSSIKTAPQAVAIMMLGAELGIGAWQAINGISVIQGKTTVSPQLMLALINRTGQLEDIKIDGDAKGCTVTMKRKGRSAHTETFTMQDAAAMQLSSKDNYRKQPAIMLKWRAVAACARVVFPDAIMGMYTPDEMGAETNEDGEIIVATPQLPATVDTTTGEIVTTPPAPELSLLKEAAAEVIEGETIEDAPPKSKLAEHFDDAPGTNPFNGQPAQTGLLSLPDDYRAPDDAAADVQTAIVEKVYVQQNRDGVVSYVLQPVNVIIYTRDPLRACDVPCEDWQPGKQAHVLANKLRVKYTLDGTVKKLVSLEKAA